VTVVVLKANTNIWCHVWLTIVRTYITSSNHQTRCKYENIFISN